MTRTVNAITTPIERVLDDARDIKGWTTIDSQGFHWLVCDLCKLNVKLTRTANIHGMQQHRNSVNCKQRQRVQARSQAAEVPEASTSTRPVPAHREMRGQFRNHPYHSRPNSRSSSLHSSNPSRSSSVHSFLPRQGPSNPSQGRSSSVASQAPPPASPTPAAENSPVIDWQELDCPGVSIEWKAGSVLATYPFLLHTFHDVGWEPIGFDHARNRIILRSEKCKRAPRDTDGNPCDTCAVMRSGAALQKAMDRASNAPKKTPYEYLNAQQMRKMLQDFNQTMRRLRSTVHNLKEQISGAQRKLDDYGRVMMLLSKGDIPGLRRILAASLKRGASPLVIVNLLERALKGLHRARGGFSARDLDIFFLAKAVGGPKLLYALQKAFGLASETTLRREKKIPTFTPSVGKPTSAEVSANIKSFCDPDINPPLEATKSGKKVGIALMWDGAALEARCTYDYARDETLGVCREHGHRVDTRVRSLASVEAIRKALFEPESPDGKVCFATEATVVTWGSYHPNRYNCVPILASPACKAETGEELRAWFKEAVINTWKANPLGAATHGEIWAMASDGDAVYRYAKYLECLKDGVEVDTVNGYGKRLKDLEGLNLFTSKDGIVGTCDPKHIFKRFATLLRNTSGCMVGQTNIKSIDILKHLTGHDGLSEEAVRELLNPTDKQNVPKAVSLLQRLNQLDEDPSLDPSEQHRRKTIIFLGKFFYLFLEPFINVKMDLSAQVESLSAFAHVAAALYMQHQTANLTGALYADTQAVVKNIIFTIARMQEVDEDLLLHILQEGTDRLEVLFGETRTQDHNSNYDIKQFCEKAAIGALIHAAYARNPDLDRGHRRLSLFGTLGIDHVNARSWEGNVRVGDVNLKRCWDAGRARALALLKKYLPDSFAIPDFGAVWKKPKHDLLRPKGVYVGTRRSADDARSEDESDDTSTAGQTVTAESQATTTTPSMMPTTTLQGESTLSAAQSGKGDRPDTLDLEEEEDHDSASSVEMASPTESNGDRDRHQSALPATISVLQMRGATQDVGEDLENVGDDIPIGFSLEDCFAEESEDEVENEPSAGAYSIEPDRVTPATTIPSEKPSKYLIVDGKQVHKSSIIASMLSSKWSKKYGDRLLRVRGMAKGTLGRAKDDDFSDSNLTENQVKTGDLAAVLIHDASSPEVTPKVFALAVVEITGFTVQGERGMQSAIDFATLSSPKTKITAQVLELSHKSIQSVWDWTGNYLRIGSSLKGSELDTRKQYVMEVNGALAYPLRPQTVKYMGGNVNAGLTTTWRLTAKDLEDAKTAVWASLNPEAEEIVVNVDLLPEISNASAFPYRDSIGRHHFVIEDLPSQLKEIVPIKRANTKVACYLCGETGIKVSEMVEHVGRHILHASRYKDEPEELQEQPGANPCGFCGRDGCFTQLKKSNKKSLVIVSTCPYRRSKMIPSTRFTEFDPESPCRNTPVHCTLCSKTASNDPRTIWRYNAGFHLMTEHTNTPIPPDLLVAVFISKREEAAMGVEEGATDDFREMAGHPATESLLEAMEVENDAGEAQRETRGRSETITGPSQRGP